MYLLSLANLFPSTCLALMVEFGILERETEGEGVPPVIFSFLLTNVGLCVCYHSYVLTSLLAHKLTMPALYIALSTLEAFHARSVPGRGK